MRFKVSVSATALALATVAWAVPAVAQNSTTSAASAATTEESDGLGVIVVTARRVSENLQDVPVAVTAFGGQELINQGARTALDIQTLTPNLRLREGAANPSALIIAIRGQVQSDTVATLDPSIGVYVDEVYYARTVGINSGLLDLERVEVLKGPQGTLFGRNTTGGALNITTNRPDMDELSGNARLTVGNFGRFDIEGVLNIPLVTDKLAIRLAAQRQKNDGFGRDLVTGERMSQTDNYTLRGRLRWTPNEDIDIVLSGERFNLDQNGPALRPVYVSPNEVMNIPGLPVPLVIPPAPEIIAALSSGGCFDPTTFSCPGSYRPGSSTFASYIGGNYYDASLSFVPRVKARTSTASLNATYDFGGAVLKYIGAYREVSNTNPIDIDGTPFDILHTTTRQSGHSWSHELQLAGGLLDDALNYTTGIYRFTESGRDGSDTFALPLLNPFNPSNTLGFIRNSAFAVYGQGTFQISDQIAMTAGLRWSEDKKSLDSRTSTAGVCAVPAELRNNPAVPCSAIFRRKDSALSYNLSANYNITDDVMVYVRTGKGYRSGGFNLRGTSALSFTPFAPETTTDYEIGLKSEFMDNRARFNLALFTSNYNDIQKSTIVSNGSGGTATIVANAAKARVKGLEAEFSVLPIDGLRLSGTLGLTDAKYTNFPGTCVFPGGPASGTPCDRSGEPFELIPKASWSLTGEYRYPVGEGELLFRLDYSHVSSIVNQGIVFSQTPDLKSYVTQPGYGLLNGRVAWEIGDSGATVALWGRNLTKQRYMVGFLDFVNSGLGFTQGQPGTPRELGVEFGFRF